MFGGVFFIGEGLRTSIVTLFVQIVVGGLIYGILSIFYFYFTNDQIIGKMFQKIQKIQKNRG